MTMRRILCGAASVALAFLVTAAHAHAGERPHGVVELFTSQGCNSCPPADAVLEHLSKRGDVIALGYHVDYWDYRGWRDTLATSANTARQNEYRRSFDAHSVYTPQAVINGRVHVNGAEGNAVETALAEMHRDGKGLSVDLDVRVEGDTLVIETGAAAGPVRKAHLRLVYLALSQSIEIAKGENRGKQVRYVNPVLETQAAGMWHGKPARFELPASEIAKKGPGGCAILLQEVKRGGLPGPILGAAYVPVPGS